MQKELGAGQNLNEVRARFLHHFAKIFGYHDIVEGADQSGDLKVLNGWNDLNP